MHTQSHPEHHPLPVSLEPELDLAHTHQSCEYSLSQAAEQGGESQHVFDEIAWLWHWRVRGGELLLSQTLLDPELHYGQISTTQKPVLTRNAHSKTLYNAWSLLLEAQSSCVILLIVLGLVRCLRWKMGTKLGRSQPHVRPVGRFSRARTVGTPLLSLLDAAETLHLPCLVGQVWFPGATYRAIKQCPKVWRQSWGTARNRIRFGTIRWVNSLGIK